MKNKIVEVNNNERYHYKILDKVIENGSTYYLVLGYEDGKIFKIKPDSITKFVSYNNATKEFEVETFNW
jgi:hypothetical protein